MLEVRSLLGQKQVSLACTCLGSLQVQCQQELYFVFHDDGTLKPSDHDVLRRVFTRMNIISKQQADDIVIPRLAGYPLIKAYRNTHPLALKLIDITLLASSGQTQIFCDTDVLFIEPFRFPEFLPDTELIFMQDFQESYALWPWQLTSLSDGLISKLNSGLIMFNPTVIDLALIELALSVISRSNLYAKRIFWVEQTCWAVLAARLDTYFFELNQVSVAQPDHVNLAAETVAIHFVSSFRHRLSQYTNWQSQQKSINVLRKVKARHTTISGLLMAEVQRHF